MAKIGEGFPGMQYARQQREFDNRKFRESAQPRLYKTNALRTLQTPTQSKPSSHNDKAIIHNHFGFFKNMMPDTTKKRLSEAEDLITIVYRIEKIS